MCKLGCLCDSDSDSGSDSGSGSDSDLKHFRLTSVARKTFIDGTVYCILQWSGSFVMICKYSINDQTPMFSKALLTLRKVDGWLMFFGIRQNMCFVRGAPIDLFRTVARFVERYAHTLGSLFGFLLAPPWPEPGWHVSTLRVQVEIFCDCVSCSRFFSMF